MPTAPSDGGYRLQLLQDFESRRRHNASYSLRAYARSLDVSITTLSQVLSGKRPLTLKTARKIVERGAFSPPQAHRLLHAVQASTLAPAPVDPARRELEADTFSAMSE